MTRPGIEPWSSGPLANARLVREIYKTLKTPHIVFAPRPAL